MHPQHHRRLPPTMACVQPIPLTRFFLPYFLPLSTLKPWVDFPPFHRPRYFFDCIAASRSYGPFAIPDRVPIPDIVTRVLTCSDESIRLPCHASLSRHATIFGPLLVPTVKYSLTGLSAVNIHAYSPRWFCLNHCDRRQIQSSGLRSALSSQRRLNLKHRPWEFRALSLHRCFNAETR
jgi:hypothetical protein